MKELVKKYGMNLLIPPAPSIDPGDLIVGYADGTARKAAWISIIGIQPTPDYDAHAAPTSMAFVVSRRMDVKAGLSLTGRILESFGLTATKADATFSKTAALKLHMEIIAPSQRVLKNLDQVIASLAAPELTANAAFKDRQLYVVTRTYRAKGLRIMLYDKEGGVVRWCRKFGQVDKLFPPSGRMRTNGESDTQAVLG